MPTKPRKKPQSFNVEASLLTALFAEANVQERSASYIVNNLIRDFVNASKAKRRRAKNSKRG